MFVSHRGNPALFRSAGDVAFWLCFFPFFFFFESRPVGGNAALSLSLPLHLSLSPQSTKQVPHWSEVPKHDATQELGGRLTTKLVLP